MKIEYQSVENLLTEYNIKFPELNIFNDRGNVIKVAYWQPKGEMIFQKEEGFRCSCDEHLDKAEAFLRFAQEQRMDVVVTPEYSVPWAVLEKIISNKEIWPKYGKLWCLGMEGINCDKLTDFCENNQKNPDYKIIVENMDRIIFNGFFSCVSYLFYTENKLIIILQFKTTTAADQWSELEAPGLSTGNYIYYFKDNSSGHCLFTYICADALNQNISRVKGEIEYDKCIILHPQLNPKPLHDSFSYMRSSFLNYTQGSIRIISVNWAKDTLLKGDGEREDITIEDSYSACYYNQLSENNMTEMMCRNRPKGIELSIDGHIFIWHMPSNEHSMSFSIDNFGAKGVNTVSANHREPLGEKYLEYNFSEHKWKEEKSCDICSIDWEWLRKEFELEKCTDGVCNIIKLHRFFSILFSEKPYNNIKVQNGETQVLFDIKNKDKTENRCLRERCKYVNEELKEQNIPPKFAELKNNYKWVLSDKGNIEPKNKEGNPINVVYVDSSDECVIKKGIIEFQRLMGEAAKDRMLLYHLSNKGIKYYDKLYNMQINNPNLTSSVELIKE